MNIPVARLKKALHEIMYKDKATIYRSVKIKNPITGAVEFEHRAVYENIPCKLSQYKDLNANKDDRTQHIEVDFRMTCDPEIEIEENDIADILHEGRTYKLLAGTAFNYPTHKEISMRRRREGKQK